jgi:FO synthase
MVGNPLDRALARARAFERLGDDDAYALLHAGSPRGVADGDREWSLTEEICELACRQRDRDRDRVLTWSPKVFLPVTNLCRDRCTYCTFRRDPGEAGEWTMTPDEIRQWSERGKEAGCIEALMCLGDKPEIAFRGFTAELERWGAASTAEYVGLACSLALEADLLPHTNAGLLSYDEMRNLRPVNVSFGLMLENVSPRLRARGMPHQHAPDKDPAARISMIADAGKLRIPFTSGILVGIGETEAERIASLLELRRLHEQYGHLQEVIIQNFRHKDSTPMSGFPEPTEDEFIRCVAIARLLLGPAMNIQAPPNLSPQGHARLVNAGINDWGGISPVTVDYVNPGDPWPHLEDLAQTCSGLGFELEPRLPVYPEYVNDEFLDPDMRLAVERFADLPAAVAAQGGAAL